MIRLSVLKAGATLDSERAEPIQRPSTVGALSRCHRTVLAMAVCGTFEPFEWLIEPHFIIVSSIVECQQSRFEHPKGWSFRSSCDRRCSLDQVNEGRQAFMVQRFGDLVGVFLFGVAYDEKAPQYRCHFCLISGPSLLLLPTYLFHHFHQRLSSSSCSFGMFFFLYWKVLSPFGIECGELAHTFWL